MTAICRVWSGVVLATILSAGVLQAQGRGGGAWTTVGGDAQRTSSQRTDPKISVEALQKPEFQYLWKRKIDEGSARAQLTQPILLPNIIAYKGFKALAFVASSSGTVQSIDYELNRVFWTQRLARVAASAATAACPSMPPALTKATAAALPSAGGRGRGAGAGAGGRGAAPQGPVMPGGRDAGDNVYAMAGDGMVHLMNPQVGTDQIPPIKFLAPGARVVGSILVDNFLYAATTGNCGSAANGVWALDILGEGRPVTSFETKGTGVAGSVAPTFGTDGTLYIATAAGESPLASTVVALEPKTLKQKDSFTAAAAFTSAPIVVQHKGKDLVVAANKDGRLYVLDATALGGQDHKTPLLVGPAVEGASEATGLASWTDADGTRWIAAAGRTGIVAFTLGGTTDVPEMQFKWRSAEITNPLTPLVMNGVVFAVAAGDAATGRSARGAAAVLHALDGATGKPLWSSGTTITAGAHGAGPSGGDSQVYVTADDGTLYAFGMPAER